MCLTRDTAMSQHDKSFRKYFCIARTLTILAMFAFWMNERMNEREILKLGTLPITDIRINGDRRQVKVEIQKKASE